MSKFMTIETAFQIVYDLAKQNKLSDIEVEQDTVLKAECEKQNLALDTVSDFLANNIYN